MYEKIFKKARNNARCFVKEAKFKMPKGGNRGESESTPSSSNWILATGRWNAEGIWMPDEKWKTV